MDLTTTYMGLNLKNPLVVSASPLSRNLVSLQKLQEAGASAVVMYSLFEEQIRHESLETFYHITHGTESFSEALNYFVNLHNYNHGPEEYLNHLQLSKRLLEIPVIASLNGFSNSGWISYAKEIAQTGVDGIELNMYYVAADINKTSQELEDSYLNIVKQLKQINIPIAVKLSPYFSCMGNMAKKLDDAGVQSLVLFNRFYQPDFDLESLEVVPNVVLSSPHELRLAIRWLAILYGRIKADMAATGGIHTHEDVLKSLMAGASVTMLCSTILKNGIGQIGEILNRLEEWMKVHEYESVKQMKGSMSQRSSPDPSAFERANYMKALSSYVMTPDLLYHN
ncbi:MAG: dihydroorotate dehydrogenase-like protein [Bacteroidetes bacterium]|nr:dihydroorotate dehydrogenase-like protein [Bacteroidota bacterium]